MDDLILDSLDDLPEHYAPLKVFFKPDGEKFKLTLPKTENVDGLKSAKAKSDRQAKEAKDALDALKALLIDDGEDLSGEETLAELKSLRKKHREQGDKELVPKAEIARARREAEEAAGKKYGPQLETEKTENQRLQKLVDKHLIDGGLRALATDKDFPIPLKKGAIDAIIKIARADGILKLDGEHVVAEIDGETVPAKEWLTDFVTSNSDLYAVESTGSGTPPHHGNGKVTRPGLKRSEMSRGQKVEYIRDHGQEKFNQLPA